MHNRTKKKKKPKTHNRKPILEVDKKKKNVQTQKIKEKTKITAQKNPSTI
jgi:hypothetical protein